MSMEHRLSTRSWTRLEGVKPPLVAVIGRALQLCIIDFTVLEGVRTLERQRRLVETAASWTLNSRHLTGHAVDLGAWVDGELSWHWPHYYRIADAMKLAAEEMGVAIDWGGDWRSRDGPHYQLAWDKYPA